MLVTKIKIAAVMFLVVGIAAGSVLTYAQTAAPPVPTASEGIAPEPADEGKNGRESITVKAVKPKQGEIQTMLAEVATEVAQQQQLVPLVSGTIKKVTVDIGDRVKKGQVLIELDAPMVANEVDQAEAALELAQARYNELVDDVTRRSARANIKLAEVALKKANIQGGYTRLRAEFDGVVAERNCDPGNLVQRGASGGPTSLLTVVSLDRLCIRMYLPKEFARIAERGDPVELSAQGAEHQIKKNISGQIVEDDIIGLSGDAKDFIHTQITAISPIARRAGGLRAVRIDVDNSKNRLVPGLPIGVRIHFNKTRKFLVPSQCLVKKGDGEYYVYIVCDGRAHPVAVSLHRVNDKDATISGIKATDLVITNNLGELSAGVAVKVEKER